jgi:isopenicillin N synthase-like dioxygenase
VIPIVDFAGAVQGDRAELARAGAAVHEAFTTDGFFYITNHGVPEAVIETALAEARRFFAEPADVKRKVAINLRHRGFSGIGDALMYEAKKPDNKEFFTMGLELAEDDPDVLAGEALRGPNNWPAGRPAFRHALERYYAAIGACGAMVLSAVALSLGQPAEFFAGSYRKRLQRTQFIHYPPQPPELGQDLYGVAPHTDFGCLTLLWQDNSGGLEVYDRKDKRWIDAPPIPGTLVINSGDLLARWTNDVYASTPHRVVNRSGYDRYSVATFYDPDFKAVIDPHAFGDTSETRYPVTTAGAHILGRIEKSFGYRKKQQKAS